MAACIGAAYWTLKSDVFSLDAASVSGELRYTSAEALLTAAGVGSGAHPNVLALRAADMERAIASFPSISNAQVRIGLPNRVDISVTERQPIFAVRWGGNAFLVDHAGVVLAQTTDAQAGALGIPVVNDERTSNVVPLAVGATIDPIDRDAILQLGALTPSIIDSHATSLDLAVRDDDGFVLSAQPEGWQAIFGNYTPNLRSTEIIPRQVQCLRSLVDASEAALRTVYLAPLEEACGTYLPLATPRATPTPAPPR